MRVWQSLEIKSNPLKSQMRKPSKILTQSYLEAQGSSAVVFSPPESGQQSGNSQMSHETASHDSKTIFYLKCESQEICSWKIACRFFFFFWLQMKTLILYLGRLDFCSTRPTWWLLWLYGAAPIYARETREWWMEAVLTWCRCKAWKINVPFRNILLWVIGV